MRADNNNKKAVGLGRVAPAFVQVGRVAPRAPSGKKNSPLSRERFMESGDIANRMRSDAMNRGLLHLTRFRLRLGELEPTSPPQGGGEGSSEGGSWRANIC
jgi:hypothetical protein